MPPSRGQSLIEIIVAMAVFVLAISAIFAISGSSFKNSQKTQEYFLAKEIAREGVEASRAIRDNNWANLTNGDHGLTNNNNQWIFQGTEDDVSAQLPQGKRKINISDLGTDRKLIVATVAWDNGGASIDRLQSSTILTNWQKTTVPPSYCHGAARACDTFVASPTCSTQDGCLWTNAFSGATTNPGFTSNSTGWTGADWLWRATTETRVATGGNPGGFIRIRVPKTRNILGGGYWRQAFTTTVANPTATVSFDWKNIAYASGGTVTAYVFVDTGSGVPMIGTQVWSQTITTNTAWASVSSINVSNKVATAGTYYLKVAYYVAGGSSNVGPFTIGFDNVQLNWSKTGSCSGTPTTCDIFLTQTTCQAQLDCQWIP